MTRQALATAVTVVTDWFGWVWLPILVTFLNRVFASTVNVLDGLKNIPGRPNILDVAIHSFERQFDATLVFAVLLVVDLNSLFHHKRIITDRSAIEVYNIVPHALLLLFVLHVLYIGIYARKTSEILHNELLGKSNVLWRELRERVATRRRYTRFDQILDDAARDASFRDRLTSETELRKRKRMTTYALVLLFVTSFFLFFKLPIATMGQ